MMGKWLQAMVCIVVLAVPVLAKANDPLRREAVRLFGRLPKTPVAETAETRLGRALFWDASLSANGKTSCATCHSPGTWGADAMQFSLDAQGKLSSRHSQTVFNAMLQPTLRWLGDRQSGAQQAEGSLTGSMGFATKDAAVAQLRARGYGAAFAVAYPQTPDPVTGGNFGRAVAAYQATLITPAKFDRFMDGDDTALTAQQRAGLHAFIDTGCVTCHNGPLLGGTVYRKFGITKDYWTATGTAQPDTGRFSMTQKEDDRFVFRVPMLRNIVKTGPYFHDGSVSDLATAVRIMADVQLGVSLDQSAVAAIVAFLGSLTGAVPANYAPPKDALAAVR